MQKWLALLRGINVGGHNKIAMAELRDLFRELGFEDVESYIQTGNVAFQAKGTPNKLAATISEAIREKWGYEVSTLVISPQTMEEITAANPYAEAGEANPTRVFVGFLDQKPAKVELKPVKKDNEHFSVIGRAVYLHCPDGVGRSKLTNAYFEKGLGVSMTMRNLRVVTTLQEMLN